MLFAFVVFSGNEKSMTSLHASYQRCLNICTMHHASVVEVIAEQRVVQYIIQGQKTPHCLELKPRSRPEPLSRADTFLKSYSLSFK